MKLSACETRARDMTVPHWGPPPPLMDGSWVGDGTGSWHQEHVPVDMKDPPMTMFEETINGVQYNNVTWHKTCGSSWLAVPHTLPNDTTPSAIVVNVTAMTNTNADRPLLMHLQSCDGKVFFNTSKPGVFVVPGSSVAVFIERWYGSVDNKIKGCPGQGFVAYTSATLEDACKVDTTLAECTKKDRTVKGQSTGTKIKQSLVVAAVGLLSAVVTMV